MGHAENKRERKEQAEIILIHAQQGMSMQEIAERLGCDRSTVSRYLQEFSDDGLLVEVSRGRYRLDATAYLSQVKLSLPEALSIFLALRRSIRQTTHAPQFMITALEKIAVALRHPALTQQLVESAYNLLHSRSTQRQDDAIWETLLRGWREGIVVHIKYKKERTNEITEHDFEPYLFEPAILSHGTYVIGYSHNRESPLRTLKIERIIRATLTTQRFETPTQYNINELLKNAWGIWYGQERRRVELKFAPEIVWRVQETVWHELEETYIDENGYLYWSVELAAEQELIPWIRGWGHEVEVIAPESLRKRIAHDMRAAATLYEEE